MKFTSTILVTTLFAGALTSCGKVSETVGDKAVEKIAEAAMSKDGTKVKIDSTQGGMTITSTDSNGAKVSMEVGDAKVSEAELGVPIYPGAVVPGNAGSQRTTSAQGSVVVASFESKDSMDKVAAFYRAKMQVLAGSKAIADIKAEDAMMLGFTDDASKQTVQLTLNRSDSGGTMFSITHTVINK
jgi:hypothetical protein